MSEEHPPEHPPHYAEHLEYLGYLCEWQQDGWLYATHPVRWNFFLRPVPVGVRLDCSIRLGRLSDAGRTDWLEFVNRTNLHTLFARFALECDETDHHHVVRIRAMTPGEYRRRDFGAWLDMWHRDLDLFRDGPALEEDEEAAADGAHSEVTVN